MIERPSRTEARAAASATASAQRYPVHDGAGRTVAINVSTICSITCDAADPQTIANFLGTLPHGDEMNSLELDLVDPNTEMAAACGSASALSCYYPDQNRIVASGDSFTASDNATQLYVIAHEYGHHVANHRNNAPFANPAIDWGPKNWASFAGVCQGVQTGRYFPGAEQLPQYYDNPGEAFAESFAKNAFPNQPVPWEWPDFPDPHSPGGFAAIQRDALHPWSGDTADVRRGRFTRKGRHRRKVIKRFGTPLDGDLTMKLSGPARSSMTLKLLDSSGRVLANSSVPGPQEQLSYQVCGERGVSAVIQRRGPRTRFKLTALIP